MTSLFCFTTEYISSLESVRQALYRQPYQWLILKQSKNQTGGEQRLTASASVANASGALAPNSAALSGGMQPTPRPMIDTNVGTGMMSKKRPAPLLTARQQRASPLRNLDDKPCLFPHAYSATGPSSAVIAPALCLPPCHAAPHDSPFMEVVSTAPTELQVKQ